MLISDGLDGVGSLSFRWQNLFFEQNQRVLVQCAAAVVNKATQKAKEKKITNGDERTNFFLLLLPDEQGWIKDTFR